LIVSSRLRRSAGSPADVALKTKLGEIPCGVIQRAARSAQLGLAAYNAFMRLAHALSLIVLAQTLLAADTIPSAKAKEHVGQDGTVCGKVADTRYLESARRPTFLNFDERYPNHTFTAVIFGENRAKFGAPEKDYLDRDICVTGKIEDYNGKPQIIVTEPQQIKAAPK
jgi:hypothetical protein